MKTLRNRADRLFSALVRSRGHCEVKGCTSTNLQTAHWISRRYAWTRTYEPNAFCLCAGHHRWYTDHPTDFGTWAIDQRPGVYTEVSVRSLNRAKFDWVAEVERLESLCRERGLWV